MRQAVVRTDLPLANRREGKVRDVYFLENDRIAIVATDRISAFDIVLPTPIPGKGRLLTDISARWMRWIEDEGLCRTFLESTDPADLPGLTPEELKEVITERLAEFITAPHVTVMVQQMNSRSVSLMGAGAVRQGLVPLGRKMRVLDAIVAMGGFSIWAKKNRVTVLRETPEGRREYRFNYDAYVDGKAPGTNLLLVPGDTIIVPD